MPNFSVHEHKAVLRVRAPEEETTSAGIILSANLEAREAKVALVVSAGGDLGFDVGDHVLVYEDLGMPFRYEGSEYVLMHKDQIVAGLPDLNL